MPDVHNWQLGRQMSYPYEGAYPDRQWAFVFNINRCIACQTCTYACKSTWTFSKGQEYMWWNNVETKPYGGYPRFWDIKTLALLDEAHQKAGKAAKWRTSPKGTPGQLYGTYDGLTSAIDVMPTVLDIKGQKIPEWVQGISLLPKVRDGSAPGRDFTVTTMPFANPGDPVHAVDNIRRNLYNAPVTTITSGEWSLLYSVDEGVSELYRLSSDPGQQKNVIASNEAIAKGLHEYLVAFMRDTNLPQHLLESRLELRL